MRKVANAGWGIVGCLIAVPIWLMLFWPIGLIFAVGVLLFAEKFFKGLSQSQSGSVKTATCPLCEGRLNFWIATAFVCPHCKNQLMPHGERLYALGRERNVHTQG